MNILLVGKLGQIGAEISSIAQSSGHTVIAFSKEELDITKYEKVKDVLSSVKPDAVINASGYHLITDCENYPDRAFELNVYAVKHLAVQCEKIGARFVNYSTDKVFDGSKQAPHEEDDPTNPLQVYGLSKLAGEIVTHISSNKAITIRTCGVYGGKFGSRVKKGNFVLYILHEAKKKESLDVSSDQIASFINAQDLAKTTLQLLEKNADAGVYHVVNDGYDSWVNFANEIIKIAGLSMNINPVDRSKSQGELVIPSFQALANNKVKKYVPEMPTWQDGLRRYIEYLRDNKSL